MVRFIYYYETLIMMWFCVGALFDVDDKGSDGEIIVRECLVLNCPYGFFNVLRQGQCGSLTRFVYLISLSIFALDVLLDAFV